jgi:hypothetical protein
VFSSRFLPCADCGASVERSSEADHTCDPQRLVDFQMFRLQKSVAGFEHQVREYLDSATGQFEAWLAARQVRHSS